MFILRNTTNSKSKKAMTTYKSLKQAIDDKKHLERRFPGQSYRISTIITTDKEIPLEFYS